MKLLQIRGAGFGHFYNYAPVKIKHAAFAPQYFGLACHTSFYYKVVSVPSRALSYMYTMSCAVGGEF